MQITLCTKKCFLKTPKCSRSTKPMIIGWITKIWTPHKGLNDEIVNTHYYHLLLIILLTHVRIYWKAIRVIFSKITNLMNSFILFFCQSAHRLTRSPFSVGSLENFYFHYSSWGFQKPKTMSFFSLLVGYWRIIVNRPHEKTNNQQRISLLWYKTSLTCLCSSQPEAHWFLLKT